MLHGSVIVLICSLALSCGNADESPPPPEQFQQIEPVEKTDDCFVTNVGMDVREENASAARLLAGSPCKYTYALDVQEVRGIRDLSFARGIRYVLGPTSIVGNSELRSFDGLGSLERTGELFIRNNASLEDMKGLEGLEEVKPPDDPLHQESLITGTISILDNDSLKTLDGLENVRVATALEIRNNTSLRSIESLYGIRSLDYLTITNSPVPQCQIDKLLSGLENEPIDVELNAVGRGECSDE
jgi:hypothetical protein